MARGTDSHAHRLAEPFFSIQFIIHKMKGVLSTTGSANDIIHGVTQQKDARLLTKSFSLCGEQPSDVFRD